MRSRGKRRASTGSLAGDDVAMHARSPSAALRAGSHSAWNTAAFGTTPVEIAIIRIQTDPLPAGLMLRRNNVSLRAFHPALDDNRERSRVRTNAFFLRAESRGVPG